MKRSKILSDRIRALISENYKGASAIRLVLDTLEKSGIDEQSDPT